MQGKPAIYLGRIVSKENFRVFVYGSNDEKKLVKSWDEFEANMQTGIWFASVEDVKASKAESEVHTLTVDDLPDQGHGKSKRKSKPRPKPMPKPVSVVEEVDDAEQVLPDDGSVFEVTDGA